MVIRRKKDDWYHLSSVVAEGKMALGDNDIACWTRTGERFSRGTPLRLLRSGHRKWNQWRSSLPDIEWYSISGRPTWIPGFIIRLPSCDLRNLDFVNCELAGVDFTNSLFARSNLSAVDFRRLTVRPVFQPKTVLNGCNFRSAKFVSTILDQTNAIGCDFSHAELNGTKIRGADLRNCKFYRTMVAATFEDTDITNSSFEEAHLLSTTFINVDLGATRSLNRAHAYPPITLDARTLLRSGILPRDIYRACGMSDAVTKSIKRTLKQRRKRVRCFISYSSKDENFVATLRSDLEDNGIETWYAPRDMPIGARTRVDLDRAILNADKLVIVLSRKSIVSAWVEQEVETALERERQSRRLFLLPLRIDESVMKTKVGWAANLRRTRNVGDFSKHRRNSRYFSTLGQLINDIRS
jgi:uncharacterized protein YjbI with pentapeptide repeats